MPLRLRQDAHWWEAGAKRAILLGGRPDPRQDPSKNWDPNYLRELDDPEFEECKDGDVWRMDFSRFNTYKEAPPAKDSGGWVWTRHGIWDSHIPECFVKVQFTTNLVAVKKPRD